MSLGFATTLGVAAAVGLGRPHLAAAMAAVAWQPAAAGVCGAAWYLWRRWRLLALSRERIDENRRSVVLFAELVSLGIDAGLPFTAATRRAASAVDGEVGEEARRVLRRARILGSAEALASSPQHLGGLFALAARATATGAPLGPAVSGFVAEARKERAAEREAMTKRLPVQLLLPLTFLILPGFVVLTLGPALLSGLQRIQL